jgi:predicted permease
MMATLTRDVRHGARALWRQPGFTAVAVLLLALGIGLNTALFSLVDTLLFRPLPVDRPNQIASVFTTGESGEGASTTSYQDFRDLRTANQVFSDMVGHSLMFVTFSGAAEHRLVMGEVVTTNYFSALGVRLQLGRAFLAEEETGEGAHPVVVLSDRLWRHTFQARPDVVGQTIRLKNRNYTVVGVASASYPGLLPGISTELWVPVSMVDDVEPVGNNDFVPSATGRTRLERRGARWMLVKARLKDGVTARAAEADLARIMSGLAATYPVSNRARTVRVTEAGVARLLPEVDDALRPAGFVLLVAVGLVLLVACANLTGMLLARGAARVRELAVRAALGASRARLIRLLAIESVLLALAGGTAGLVLAIWATRMAGTLQAPIQLPLALAVSADVRAVTFALVAAVVSSVAFGLLPALRATRLDLTASLKADGALAARPGRRFGLRHALVVGQVAVSFVLAVTGLLLTRSMMAGRSVDPGFPTRGLVQAGVSLNMQGYTDEASAAFFDRALRRVAELPSVTGVALSVRMPLTLNLQMTDVVRDGDPADDLRSRVGVDTTEVTRSYFQTMGIPIRAGRAFDERDTPASGRVVIVNQALAERLWPGRTAVGQRLRLRGRAETTLEVVGVSADYKIRTLGESPRPVLHFALDQRPSGTATIVARTAGDANALVPAIERELRAIDPDVVLLELQTFEGAIATSLFGFRLGSWLIGGLAALALTLAGLGLYGVVAFSVSRRTREIGIRVAIGADRRAIVRAVVGEGLVLVAIGVAIGLVLAIAAASALGSVLLGVGALDAPSYAAATAVLVVAASLACALPARRAAAIDPTVALRQS